MSAESVQEAFEAAEKDLREGRQQPAERRLQELAAMQPPFAPACFRLAMLAFRRGDNNSSLNLLDTATAAEPEVAAYRYRLAFVQQHLGMNEEAADNFVHTARLDPENVSAMLKAGMLLTAIGQTEAGAEILQRAVLTEPALDQAPNNPKMTPAARQEIATALQTLNKHYKRMNQQILDELASKYPAKERDRFERAMRILYREEKAEYNHPMQRPEFLLIPGMRAQPWLDKEQFDWIPRVEAAYDDIRRELDSLLEEQAEFSPYIVANEEGTDHSKTRSGTDFSSLVGSQSWTSFHMVKKGVISENYNRCPKTMDVMESLPYPEAEDYMPEIFFSRLQPDGHIIPHYGQMNFRLTVHLGLIIPDGCGIRVGEETRHWEAGKVFAFDDSFEHEAWNRGDSERIVLIFEAWHPDIRQAEIDGLQMFFHKRAEWLRRCQPGGRSAIAATMEADNGTD
ncbi:MAG: aspartyl/asparaginyl beta-hydroxylase domain-containing protein [Gammaproteobacteria bacterium]|nr:aspartyl/asparaginyl beta-hydroxylase domain-containing protein [Gammaproteobacteria bacterium]